MIHRRPALTGALAIVAAASLTAPALATQDKPAPGHAPDLSGLHAFDLRVGTWKMHNRVLPDRLMGSHAWETWEGTQTFRQMMGGYANVDENVFHTPRGDYNGVTLRAYNNQTGEWAIWWLDGRKPFDSLDPPMKGRFKDGVGIFYAKDTLRGRPVLVRFLWSKFTPNSAHWEQAYSGDGGKTWETNWITDFERVQ